MSSVQMVPPRHTDWRVTVYDGAPRDNFGFENPNWATQRSSGLIQQENVVDTIYEGNDTLQLNVLYKGGGRTSGGGGGQQENFQQQNFQNGSQGKFTSGHFTSSGNQQHSSFKSSQQLVRERQEDVNNTSQHLLTYQTRQSNNQQPQFGSSLANSSTNLQSSNQNISGKHRSRYAELGLGDLGIPTHPGILGSPPEKSKFQQVEQQNNQLKQTSLVNLQHLSNSQRNLHHQQPHLQQQNLHRNQSASIQSLQSKNLSNNSQQFVDGDGFSRLHISTSDNIGKQQRQRGYDQFRSFSEEQVNGHIVSSNQQQHQTVIGQNGEKMAVDYSPHDFRQSFQAIDQAARGGTFYPQGGVRVKKEGDTTIVTEHRDPYSFYWQLDQIRRKEATPPPPRIPDHIPVEEENVIEEVIHENSLQIQSPDSHDSGIQVEYTRPSKPVKMMSEQWETGALQQRHDLQQQQIHQQQERVLRKDDKKPLPPGWERHSDPDGFSYYWHVDSGTVQREAPPPLQKHFAQIEEEAPLYVPTLTQLPSVTPPAERPRIVEVPRMVSEARIIQIDKPVIVERRIEPPPPQQPVIVERAFKQTTTKRRVENDTSDDRDVSAVAGAIEGPKETSSSESRALDSIKDDHQSLTTGSTTSTSRDVISHRQISTTKSSSPTQESFYARRRNSLRLHDQLVILNLQKRNLIRHKSKRTNKRPELSRSKSENANVSGQKSRTRLVVPSNAVQGLSTRASHLQRLERSVSISSDPTSRLDKGPLRRLSTRRQSLCSVESLYQDGFNPKIYKSSANKSGSSSGVTLFRKTSTESKLTIVPKPYLNGSLTIGSRQQTVSFEAISEQACQQRGIITSKSSDCSTHCGLSDCKCSVGGTTSVGKCGSSSSHLTTSPLSRNRKSFSENSLKGSPPPPRSAVALLAPRPHQSHLLSVSDTETRKAVLTPSHTSTKNKIYDKANQHAAPNACTENHRAPLGHLDRTYCNNTKHSTVWRKKSAQVASNSQADDQSVLLGPSIRERNASSPSIFDGAIENCPTCTTKVSAIERLTNQSLISVRSSPRSPSPRPMGQIQAKTRRKLRIPPTHGSTGIPPTFVPAITQDSEASPEVPAVDNSGHRRFRAPSMTWFRNRGRTSSLTNLLDDSNINRKTSRPVVAPQVTKQHRKAKLPRIKSEQLVNQGRSARIFKRSKSSDSRSTRLSAESVVEDVPSDFICSFNPLHTSELSRSTSGRIVRNSFFIDAPRKPNPKSEKAPEKKVSILRKPQSSALRRSSDIDSVFNPYHAYASRTNNAQVSMMPNPYARSPRMLPYPALEPRNSLDSTDLLSKHPQPQLRVRVEGEPQDAGPSGQSKSPLRRISQPTSLPVLREQNEDVLDLPIRFAVRSLGWTEIAEEDLTPERSSRAVNKAIVDLSTGKNDLIDNVAKWGDGKELIMELDDHDLRLIDPDSEAVLHTQPIHQIRVWGVGRDNGRDFAYVARDRQSRRFMCHVFRCDTPARTIANTLRDICKRLMLERRPNSLSTSNNTQQMEGGASTIRKSESRGSVGNQQVVSTTERRRSSQNSGFPTPMEEPRKIIRCHFLGVTQVSSATGMEVLNEAVDRLVGQVRQERWILCDVNIAPSTITIQEVAGNVVAECRIRFLSFLGIGGDVKLCAFIMHTSTDNYMCYVFHVEPSAGAMAKTIEAACKLRYQKVLDAHNTPNDANRRTSNLSSNNGRTWGDSMKDAFGSLTGRRSTRSSHNY